MAKEKENTERTRREIDHELDRFEVMVNELRVQYEQYFIDILPQPPEKLHQQVRLAIRTLLRAPFKNSANRFRLRNLIHRYQTYDTYWERVRKQREEGSYRRDKFKAEMRTQQQAVAARSKTKQGSAEKQIRELFQSYRGALMQRQANGSQVDYEEFKRSLLRKTKKLREKHGTGTMRYKVVVRGDKVLVRASPV